MTRFLRCTAAAFALSLGCATPASASSFSPDFTDLWYNTAESGWGFNVIQQGDILFGSLFVYGSDNSARWFVADAMVPQTTTSGTFQFKSKFYQATGPFFGAGTFNAADVRVTEVGEATITFTTSTTATLVYNVGANTVTKTMTRQTFRNNNPLGAFFGGVTSIVSACATSSDNGKFANLLGNLTLTVNGSAVSSRIEYTLFDANGNSFPAACVLTGPYSQQGRLATISGTWTCSQGSTTLNNGTFTIGNLDTQVNGITGSFAATDQFCTYAGRFGGLRNANN